MQYRQNISSIILWFTSVRAFALHTKVNCKFIYKLLQLTGLQREEYLNSFVFKILYFSFFSKLENIEHSRC